MRDSTRSDHSLPGLPERIVRRFAEPAFWIIQAAVLVITAIHILFEAGLSPNLEEGLVAAHHLPVVLYIAPVAYAGLSYGWEGGVLTGLWAGALASINIVVWHRQNYEWVFEAVFILIVIGMGVLLAIPVERERRQRRLAEAAARRLETINQIAATATPTRSPVAAVQAVLGRMVTLLSLEDAGVILRRREHSTPVVATTWRDENDPILSEIPDTEDVETSPWVSIPLETEHMRGHLLVKPSSGELTTEEDDLLVTVGNELAVRAENAMLIQQEQEMLATYVRLVTEAQEEERRRLARDLHDGPAQHLALLVRDLEPHLKDADGGGTDIHRNAREILEEVRRVARDQRPTLLDDLGLVPALEWLAEHAQERTSADVDLATEGPIRRLPSEIEVALYRITQEALRNAELHADATQIEIEIIFGQDDLELAITDDGQGFDPAEHPNEYVRAGRLGLMGMQERSQLVGGTLGVTSSRGEGTKIAVHLPLGPQ